MAYSLEELKKQKKSSNSSIQLSSNISKLSKNIMIRSNDSIDGRINQIVVKSIDTVAQSMKEQMQIIFIIDKSASCSGLEKVTSQEIYNLLQKQKMKFDASQLKISIVLFDNNINYVFDNEYINKLKKFSYIADGGRTSIYDAICKTLIKYKSEDSFKNTIVTIMTDGMDNSSNFYTKEDTKRIIQECKKIGWEFIFLGANIDAKQVANSIGINYKNAANYSNTIGGVKANFEAICEVIDGMHFTGTIKDNWDKAININNSKQLNNPSAKILQLSGGHHE